MSDTNSMDGSNWSEKRRKAAWSMACGDRSNYVSIEGGIEYVGPVPRVCACGDYHAPGETCAIFGATFAPPLRRPQRT